jgi:hypothetical protein
MAHQGSGSNVPGGGSGRGRADWRGKARGPASGPARTGAKGTAWQQRGDRAYVRALRWYRIKLATFSFLAVALIALFLWWVFRIPRITPLLALAVTEYGPAVPPNAWASEDVARLAEMGGTEREDREQIVDFTRFERLSGTGVQVFSELRDAIVRSKGTFRKRHTVIVYLSLHGVSDDHGMPCLLLPTSSPHDPATWLPLVDVLKYLFPQGSEHDLPANKLVILDCNRMDANWRLGLLYNSFADRLEQARAEAGIPGLLILNSTSPGQIGWTSPEQLQGSVFGFFVYQGLLGAADIEEPGNGDNKVSARELSAYVKKHVSAWVRENRGDEQEPMLLGEQDENFRDFTLVYSKYTGETELPERVNLLADQGARWQPLDDLWQRHATLHHAAVWRSDPLGWEEFQQKLLWMEQLALAGPAYQPKFEETRSDLDRLAKRLEHSAREGVAAHNLPLALRFHADAETEAQRKQFRDAWAKAPGKFDAKAAAGYPWLAVAQEAWDWCRANPQPERWPALFEYLAKARRVPATDPLIPTDQVVEIHFLRMLQAYLDAEAAKANWNPIQTALAARRLAEQAASPDDDRIHHAVVALVDAADAERRQAEDQLFIGTPEAIKLAHAAFLQAAGEDGKSGKYGEAVKRAEKLREAFLLRDRAWSEIPYLAQWVHARLTPDVPARLDQLHELILAVQDLSRELELALARGQTDPQATLSPNLGRLEASIRRLLDDGLRKEFFLECDRLKKAGDHWQTFQEIGVVLAVPLLTGEDRQFLRNRKYLEIGSRRVGQEAAIEPAARRVAPGKGGTAGSDYLLRLTDGKRPEHAALTILDRKYLEADSARSRSAPAPSTPGVAGDTPAEERIHRMAAKGKEVRARLAGLVGAADAWMRETTAKLKLKELPTPVEAREGYSRADRAVRAAAPWLDYDPRRDLWRSGEDRRWLGEDPAHRLARLDLHYLLAWHARRALDDFWGPAPSEERPFFEIAAASYLQSAEKLFPADAGVRDPLPAERKLLADRREAARKPLLATADDVAFDKTEPAAKLVVATTADSRLPPGSPALYLLEAKDAPLAAQTVPLLRGAEEKTALRRVGGVVGPNHREIQLAPAPPYWLSHANPVVRRAESDAVELHLVALYRGHLRYTPLVVRPPEAGVVVATDFVPYPPPTIQVHGQGAQDTSLVFIFDCSGSMTEKIPVTTENRVEWKSRFDVARESFKEVLKNLANYPGSPYQVSVFVYGHRRGWAADNKTMVMWDPLNPTQQKPAVGRDAELRPGNDVERLWDMRPLTPGTQPQLNQKLDAQRPVGETPLYLAILQALEHLGQREAASGRRIIAITDGVNEQSSDKVDLSSVTKALAQPEYRDIHIDVLGFSMTDNHLYRSAEAFARNFGEPNTSAYNQVFAERYEQLKRARDELPQLTAAGGEGRGAFYHVEDRAGFLTRLGEMLRPRQYEILSVKQEQRAEVFDLKDRRNLNQPIDLNLLVGVKHPSAAAAPYRIRLVQDPKVFADVELQGGEALELKMSDDARRLEHVPFVGEERDRAEVADPVDPSRRYVLRAHQPARTLRDPLPGAGTEKIRAVSFFVSLENANSTKFSPRPAEAWVQIQPIQRDAAGEADKPLGDPYVFYDLRFRPGDPVPVLSCEALQWPDAANYAEIKLWCKWNRTAPEPRGELTVERFVKDGVVRLDSLPDVSFRIKEERDRDGAYHRVKIVQTDEKRKDAYQAKVEMVPPPQKVSHQYLGKTGKVEHTFYYAAEDAGRVGGFTVRIVPRARLTDQAVTLEKPFVVRVPPKDSVADR